MLPYIVTVLALPTWLMLRGAYRIVVGPPLPKQRSLASQNRIDQWNRSAFQKVQ
jgi:hypothetical protein